MKELFLFTLDNGPGQTQHGGFGFPRNKKLAPSRHKRTTGKSGMLINGASTSYEQLRKVPPLLEDILSRWKESLGADRLSKPHPQNLAGKVRLVGTRLLSRVTVKANTWPFQEHLPPGLEGCERCATPHPETGGAPQVRVPGRSRTGGNGQGDLRSHGNAGIKDSSNTNFIFIH